MKGRNVATAQRDEPASASPRPEPSARRRRPVLLWSGAPRQVVDQVQPWIDVGAAQLLSRNFAGFVAPGYSDGVNRAEVEFFNILRERNTISIPA